MTWSGWWTILYLLKSQTSIIVSYKPLMSSLDAWVTRKATKPSTAIVVSILAHPIMIETSILWICSLHTLFESSNFTRCEQVTYATGLYRMNRRFLFCIFFFFRSVAVLNPPTPPRTLIMSSYVFTSEDIASGAPGYVAPLSVDFSPDGEINVNCEICIWHVLD